MTDIIIAIPASKTAKFDPKALLAGITTLTDHGKHILQEQIRLTVIKDAGEPAVFCMSLVDGPKETCRIRSELTMTLGRTMIRRAMRWDDPRAVEGTEKPKRILGLSYEWPMRISFFVERPCGTSFSQELASALEHAGFAIVSDPRYEGTDECVWYASRNSDHLNEILGFIAEAERALDPAWEDSCEQADAVIAERIRQVGGVYCYASDWKCFEPEYQAAQLRRCFGFRVRWRHSDEYRVGTYEFNLTVPG